MAEKEKTVNDLLHIMSVKLTLTNELLGTTCGNPSVHYDFVSKKAPDAESREEEIASIGAEAYQEKIMTVFPRNKVGGRN